MGALNVTGAIAASERISEAVYIAIGAASMCWDESGVFMSEEAELIGKALIARIEKG